MKQKVKLSLLAPTPFRLHLAGSALSQNNRTVKLEFWVVLLLYFFLQSSTAFGVSDSPCRVEHFRRGCGEEEWKCSMQGTAWRLTPEKVLIRTEVEKILLAARAKSERDYVFFAIAANTGLRLCEVIHLRKGDLDRGQLQITRRKKKVLRPELINLPGGLYDLMNSWVSSIKSDWLFSGKQSSCEIKKKDGTSYQVCEGGHVSRRDIQRKWELCCEASNLKMKGRGIHTLRHFAISEFYGLYRDLRAAQLFAGHSSPIITQVYAHVRDMKEKIDGMEVTL